MLTTFKKAMAASEVANKTGVLLLVEIQQQRDLMRLSSMLQANCPKCLCGICFGPQS